MRIQKEKEEDHSYHEGFEGRSPPLSKAVSHFPVAALACSWACWSKRSWIRLDWGQSHIHSIPHALHLIFAWSKVVTGSIRNRTQRSNKRVSKGVSLSKQASARTYSLKKAFAI